MDTVDLYSLFANAMDNAIEAVRKIDEEEKRNISVRTSEKNNALQLEFRNSIASLNIYDGDYPVTSKADKENHGYGIRSMDYISEKYGGHMMIEEKEDIFALKFLFLKA